MRFEEHGSLVTRRLRDDVVQDGRDDWVALLSDVVSILMGAFSDAQRREMLHQIATSGLQNAAKQHLASSSGGFGP